MEFVYIDETGSVGRGSRSHNQLLLAAVVVHETKVQDLTAALGGVVDRHIGWRPAGFEFHGVDIWQGRGPWAGKSYPDRLQAYEEAILLIDGLDLTVAHATIDKGELNRRYNGRADGNAYLLALQFLLEKVDRNLGPELKVLVADESKEHELRAIEMVSDMQSWGSGLVPGCQLTRVIDCLHFVRSEVSSGVQMADLVAYLLQRTRRGAENHPDSQASRTRMVETISNHTRTYRQAWPRFGAPTD